MRHLIVDGYNLLLSVPRYAEVVERDIDAARERLISDFGARVADGQEVTIVFDGGGNPASDGTPSDIGGATVIFTRSGTDADSVIEGLARKARDAGEDAEVVTSDGATRWTSLGGSVIVTRASAFARELEADESEWRGEAARPRPRATIADALDSADRERLERMSGRARRAVE